MTTSHIHFSPITVANERVRVGVESEKIRMDYLTLGGSQIFSADEAREIRDALSAALEFGNPTQEQPGTEALAVGLPLEMKCTYVSCDKVVIDDDVDGLKVKVIEGAGKSVAYLSPDDEARLRNLLNQRAKGGGE